MLDMTSHQTSTNDTIQFQLHNEKTIINYSYPPKMHIILMIDEVIGSVMHTKPINVCITFHVYLWQWICFIWLNIFEERSRPTETRTGHNIENHLNKEDRLKWFVFFLYFHVFIRWWDSDIVDSLGTVTVARKTRMMYSMILT